MGSSTEVEHNYLLVINIKADIFTLEYIFVEIIFKAICVKYDIVTFPRVYGKSQLLVTNKIFHLHLPLILFVGENVACVEYKTLPSIKMIHHQI